MVFVKLPRLRLDDIQASVYDAAKIPRVTQT